MMEKKDIAKVDQAKRPLKLAILVSLFFVGGAVMAAAQGGLAPDLILFNGKILTVDKDFNIQEAIAIWKDRILDVGDSSAILALAGKNTRTIDLKGKTVLPGLSDGHFHMLQSAVGQYRGVDISQVSSIEQLLGKLEEKIAQTPPGEVVFTTAGITPEQLREKREPTRQDLDRISPRHPVVITGGHNYTLNSLALQKANITVDTPSPEGGLIEKDPRTGELTGLILDNALRLVRGLIPPATPQQKLEALRFMQKRANAVGFTSLREPGVSAEDMRIYQQLWKSDELTLRVSMNLSPNFQNASVDELVRQLSQWGVSTGFGDAMLRLDGIGEFGIDGGFEAGLMTEPYENLGDAPAPPDYFGLQRVPVDKFEQAVVAFNRLGWRGCIHAVGDKGVDIVLAAYEKANQDHSIIGKRWILEHGHYTRLDQFERMKKLGVIISTQNHPYEAGGRMRYFWGEKRAAKVMRVKDWQDAGLVVGGGSDRPGALISPFLQLYFWITRKMNDGQVIGPDQKLSRADALRLMTINNAYITFEENLKGSIEPGKLADLVVIEEDFLTVPEEKIKEIQPVATFLGGKVVYDRQELR